MKFPWVILILIFLAGCAKDPRYDRQILNFYKVGTSRDALALQLKAIDGKLEGAKTRPPEGWSSTFSRDAHPIELNARRFEEQEFGLITYSSTRKTSCLDTAMLSRTE